MDIAIVTGAETPLGLRIIEGLIRQGCRVHGIGNNLSRLSFADRNFVAHAIDVSELSSVQQVTSEILEKEGRLDILVHAIDVTPGAAFENLPVGNLEAILKIGLLGPVMLTRLALPNLLRFRGQLINIIPANKSGNQPSAVNALIEGGLREMNKALFDQARDAGLKITNLIVRQNSELPAGTVSDELLEQTRIDPEQVARTVEFLLNANESNVPNEITLHPRLSADANDALPETPIPVDPYNAIVLPPADYCPPEEPKITTKQPERIDRTIPYTDEEMEEKIAAAIEDFEVNPERYEPKEKKPRNDNQRNQGPAQSNTEGGGQAKNRRGRRRGGRNRNRDRDNKDSTQHSGNTPQQPDPSSNKQDNSLANEGQERAPKSSRNRRRDRDNKGSAQHSDKASQHSNIPSSQQEKSVANKDQEGSPKPNRNRRRRGNEGKPKHEHTDKPKASEQKQTKATPEKKSPQTAPAEKAPAKESKPVAKKAAKKAAKKVATKKAAKKVAIKKTATKKAAKKTTTKKTPAKKAAKKAAKKKATKKTPKTE
ncbi:MAG: SDR family oxidoreductase [Opitutaceae bacterium]